MCHGFCLWRRIETCCQWLEPPFFLFSLLCPFSTHHYSNTVSSITPQHPVNTPLPLPPSCLRAALGGADDDGGLRQGLGSLQHGSLISRFVNVPIPSACPARCPPQPQPEVATILPSMAFFFSTFNCHPFVGNVSLTTSVAPCAPLSYSLPIVHSVTVCFIFFVPTAPPHHSLSPTSIKYLSSVAGSFPLAASLSLVNSSFSQLSPLSAHSLHLPRVLSLQLNCCSSSPPLSLCHYLPPLILAHSVFIRLRSLSQFGWTRLIASLPLSFPLCLQP